ncbi:hypothetical protein ACFFUC_19715 [Paracoccus cavernae]
MAGILDETAFAASIRIPRTVTAFPTSGMRIGDLVVLTTDRQFYRWDGTKWTAEVAADLIVGKLTGAQIAAGAIGTDQLAARSVVASILAIADFTNLVPDDQLQDAASWVMGVAFGLRPVTPRNDVKSVGDLYYTHSANVNNNTQYGYMRGFFPVTPGDELFVSGQVIRAAGTMMNARIQIQFFDKSETAISTVNAATISGAANTATPYEGSVVVPAGALQARFRFAAIYEGTDSNITFAAPTARVKGTGKLVVDGSIQGRHVEAETITGGLLAAAGIITKSAQIDDLVVTRAKTANLAIDAAKIANLAVSGAKIANLTVDTINIKDGAVTQVRSSANWTGVATDNTVTFVDVHTLTWNSAKAGIHLQSVRFRRRANGGGSSRIYVRFMVDGAVVEWPDGTTEFQILGLQTTDSPIQEFTFIRSMSAGSHTLRLQMRSGGNHATLGGEITDLEWYK